MPLFRMQGKITYIYIYIFFFLNKKNEFFNVDSLTLRPVTIMDNTIGTIQVIMGLVTTQTT